MWKNIVYVKATDENTVIAHCMLDIYGYKHTHLQYVTPIVHSYAILVAQTHLNVTFIREKYLNLRSVFLFSLQPLSDTFLFLRKTKRDVIRHV
jgi:hypothetical protein